MGRLRAADIGRRFDFAQKETPAVGKPTAGVIVADRVGFEPTSRLRDYLISSLLFNCDGGSHFRVISGTPVPAESRMESGFFARKALRDGLFLKWFKSEFFPILERNAGR